MTCVKANSMPMPIALTEDQLRRYLDSQQTYSAKTVVTIHEMREVKHWIINNIGRSQKLWSITDHCGREFNWKIIAGAVKSKQIEIARMPITMVVNFSKREDLMMFMLRWPSELLLNE